MPSALIRRRLRRAGAGTARLRREEGGVAAIEFAVFAGLLSLALLNAADIAIYIYQRMQVENATEMAAQAASKNCDFSQVPATTSCPGLMIALTKALQSTSLGSKVSLQSGSPSEGYYCLNASNALQYVSDVSTRPSDCSATGMPSLQPGDYIRVSSTFSYTPLFPGITVAGAFITPIQRTAIMRLE
ncbi:MAG TPA: TadE/TadG family type IV pilus assembly protein [Xanthobacteraceae bacterium]